ncbi:hypothetical protein I3843_10G003200 [Carya illinoinensis]|nr:hypothetical protein I3843_10G003200 [Carya illinoinensis]
MREIVDMGGGSKKWRRFCGSSSISSVQLLLFMVVPLIVVSGFVSHVLGPLTSNRVLLSKYPWLWSPILRTTNSSSSSSSSSSPVSSVKENGKRLDFLSQVGVAQVLNMEEAISNDSLINRSSTPPHDIEAAIQNGPYMENVYNDSVSGPTASTNKSHHATGLDRIEAGLRRARAAIKEAKQYGNQTHEILDPDYVPDGPIYRNAKAFYRSYVEMEKQLKIFVYEEGQPPLFHNGPCRSIYSTEGNFIHGIEMNEQFRTRDPEKAHLFFLPFSVVMMVQFVYVPDSYNFGPIKQTVADYINLIAGKHPYWNRSLASDHFMLSCHDWGPETSRSSPYLFKNSIRVLCNANTSEGFNPTKDVSFPEINLRTGSLKGFIGGPSPSRRPMLAFFAGGLHGPVRPVVFEHWENKDEDIRVHKYLPKGISYIDMMRKSKYCLCPSGYEVASPRVVEAIYGGCVPVLISDHYVPPFSDVLNWKTFSVEVPVKDVPNLKKILMAISPRQYIRMQRRVVQVRRHFMVQSPPKRFDVFHMILHSVWLRRLNVRVPNDADAL